MLILIIFSVWFFTTNVSGFFEEVLSEKSTGKSSSISKSSIKAESVLLATEVFPVFPDELKNSFLVGVGVWGGVAEHKVGAGPMEALEFFLDKTTPILTD